VSSILKSFFPFVRSITMGLFGPPNIDKMKAKRDVNGLCYVLTEEKDSALLCKAAKALGEIGDTRAVESLIFALKNGNGGVRLAVAKALGEIKDVRAVEPLIIALNDKYIQCEVVSALGKIGDHRAVEPLIATALKDKDIFLHETTAKVLGSLKDARAVELLITILGDEKQPAREAAAEALVNIGFPAVEPLIDALGNNNHNIRKTTAEVLERIGTPAVEPLIAALTDNTMTVRQSAAILLKKIGWEPKENETGAFYWIAANNLEECVRIGAPALTPLISTLLSHVNPESRGEYAMALRQIDQPRAVELLIEALKENDTKIAAAYALGDLKATSAIDPLIAALKDENEHMRRAAAIVLWKIGIQLDDTALRSRVVESLISAITYNDQAILTLVTIGDPRAVEPLIDTIKNGNWNKRLAAAEALGKIGDTRAVEPLIIALKDKDMGVRKKVVQALSNLKDNRAVEPLITIIQDKDLSLDVVQALGNIGDIRALDPLISMFKDGEPRIAIATALGKIAALSEDVSLQTRAMELLIAALNEKDYSVESVPQAAAEALGNIGDARAVGSLIAALDSHHMSGTRWAAAKALVDYYHSGKLDETDRKAIFEHQSEITSPHQDINRDTRGCTGISSHDDYAAIEFPL
jgi:HEAT repeat protein